jgi:phage gp29-like protein
MGFAPGPAGAITFQNDQHPRLATSTQPLGLPLAPAKFVFHKHRARSGDAARGGLIRPLGWMYLFQSVGMKDLMRFAEKFGMPFVSARVDDSAWEKDRAKIAYLVRNFGSDGGGVFSKAVELELLESGGQGGGDVYFKLLQYFGDAKTKVILGQTASSGDAGGFSKGQAQSAVRQDILEADCQALAATIRSDVLRPWVAFNFGADAPVPVVEFDCAPPEDLKGKAEMVGTLATAGYQADPEWVEKQFGVPLMKGADGKRIVNLPARPPDPALALKGETDVKKKPLTLPRPSLRMSRW